MAIANELYKMDHIYISWLTRCFIMNRKPSQAWEMYIDLETSNESMTLLNLIANDCYKMGHFFYAAKAFHILEKLDNDIEYTEAKNGAVIGELLLEIFHCIRRFLDVNCWKRNTGAFFGSCTILERWGESTG